MRKATNPKKKKASRKRVTKKTLERVSIKDYSQYTQKAIKKHYEQLKAEGIVKTSFQTYLNNSGKEFFDTYFATTNKVAGKFRLNTILSLASGYHSRFFIRYK